MKVLLLGSILFLLSRNSFAQVSGNSEATCTDLQNAEAKIVSAAYYDMPKDAKAFCYFLSRAVASPSGAQIGLDGLVQGGIEFCVNNQSKISSKTVAKEISNAIKAVKNCYSEIGQ